MANSGDVLQVPELGARVEIRRSDGELIEFDVVGERAAWSPSRTCTPGRASATR